MVTTQIKFKLSDSEKKILGKIKRQLGKDHKRYDFWFIYNKSGMAVSWEGGFELGQSPRFRNQYSINCGQRLVKNWEQE